MSADQLRGSSGLRPSAPRRPLPLRWAPPRLPRRGRGQGGAGMGGAGQDGAHGAPTSRARALARCYLRTRSPAARSSVRPRLSAGPPQGGAARFAPVRPSVGPATQRPARDSPGLPGPRPTERPPPPRRARPRLLLSTVLTATAQHASRHPSAAPPRPAHWLRPAGSAPSRPRPT